MERELGADFCVFKPVGVLVQSDTEVEATKGVVLSGS